MKELRSLHVTLSNIREKKDLTRWTSRNVSVKPEEGDVFYGNESERDAFLQKEFEKSQELKSLHEKMNKEGIKPVIIDEEGSVITRGEKPDFTQKNVSVMKSSLPGQDKLSNFLESFGEKISEPTPKEVIKSSMNLNPTEIKSQGKKAVIGTFNIEWLGTKPREEEDYKEIAQVIKDSGAQVLGIEEVSKEAALKKVMKHLPDYGYILGKSGGQKVGVIFDKNRVKYNINSIDQIDDAVVSSGLRAPLLVDMKIDNGFDFTFVVAHLKAMFDPASVEKRKEQAQKVNEWVQNHLKESKDKDVILVGDFNDFVGSEALNILDSGDIVHYVTEEAPEGFYSNIPYGGIIDHGALTTAAGGSEEEYIKGSLRTIDETEYKDYQKRVSDHKPVLFEVRSDIDND